MMSLTRIHIPAFDPKPRLTVDQKDIVHKFKNVLRLKAQSLVYIFDGQGKQWQYSVTGIDKSAVSLVKAKEERSVKVSCPKIILAFPVVREERADFILQKATELGVGEFIPFICEHSDPVKLTAKKIERWEKIIIEAARQSERLWIPSIRPRHKLEDLLTLLLTRIVASPKGKPISAIDLSKSKEVLVVVGPPGAFSPREEAAFNRHDFFPLKISEHLLRTETAAAFSVGLLRYLI